jgi:hypothetical protein
MPAYIFHLAQDCAEILSARLEHRKPSCPEWWFHICTTNSAIYSVPPDAQDYTSFERMLSASYDSASALDLRDAMLDQDIGFADNLAVRRTNLNRASTLGLVRYIPILSKVSSSVKLLIDHDCSLLVLHEDFAGRAQWLLIPDNVPGCPSWISGRYLSVLGTQTTLDLGRPLRPGPTAERDDILPGGFMSLGLK